MKKRIISAFLWSTLIAANCVYAGSALSLKSVRIKAIISAQGEEVYSSSVPMSTSIDHSGNILVVTETVGYGGAYDFAQFNGSVIKPEHVENIVTNYTVTGFRHYWTIKGVTGVDTAGRFEVIVRPIGSGSDKTAWIFIK
ncbi:MAG: DUF4879 domain-containing protein [Wolinella sp.]